MIGLNERKEEEEEVEEEEKKRKREKTNQKTHKNKTKQKRFLITFYSTQICALSSCHQRNFLWPQRVATGGLHPVTPLIALGILKKNEVRRL